MEENREAAAAELKCSQLLDNDFNQPDKCKFFILWLIYCGSSMRKLRLVSGWLILTVSAVLLLSFTDT